MFFFGGWNPFLDDLYELDLNHFVWKEVYLYGYIPRHGNSCIVIDDQLYIFGGRDKRGFSNEHLVIDLINKDRSDESQFLEENLDLDIPDKQISCNQLNTLQRFIKIRCTFLVDLMQFLNIVYMVISMIFMHWI